VPTGRTKKKTVEEEKPARKVRKTSDRHMHWSNPASSVNTKALWQDPVYKEKMRLRDIRTRELRLANPENFARRGVPDGMRKQQALALWAEAREKGKRFIQIMEDAEIVDRVVIPGSEAEMGKQALEEAFVMAVGPQALPTKLAAIRTVLEWTKAKPESKTKLTLKTADEFLDEVAEDLKVNAVGTKSITDETGST
jgi:hypothetical protein